AHARIRIVKRLKAGFGSPVKKLTAREHRRDSRVLERLSAPDAVALNHFNIDTGMQTVARTEKTKISIRPAAAGHDFLTFEVGDRLDLRARHTRKFRQRRGAEKF